MGKPTTPTDRRPGTGTGAAERRGLPIRWLRRVLRLEGSARKSIFHKYFAALFAAVVVPLLVGGGGEAWFGFRDQRAMLDARLRVEAAAAADKIQGFLDSIRDQMLWTVQLSWTSGSEQAHHIDALRLLRQAPAIVDVELIDGAGKERLRVSRVDRDVIDSGSDRTDDPAVRALRQSEAWYGPVTLNRGSEPYMRLAVAGRRQAAGVAIAQVNLKLIRDVISTIRIGERGNAFVVDVNAALVAHPDIDLVLQGVNAETKARIGALRAALAASRGNPTSAIDVEGRRVLAALAPVPGVDWTVLVVQPVSEAYAPIWAAMLRTLLLVVAGAVFALLLAFALARRMTDPIRQLEEGATQIGAGHFEHRIDVQTGDELEELAGRFNEMAGELAVSQERSERISRLKQFLAPQVAELVENAGEHGLLDSQRADVVAAFCDLRNFTAFSSQAQPEQIMGVLGEYYAVLGRIITAYEATQTSFSGDGLMLLLNAPVRCEQPALWAVRMAMEMQHAVQALAAGWRERGWRIGFGIGMAEGPATVGRIGYENRLEYTAIGHVVNLASRLCSEARDGEILVDAALAEAVGDGAPIVPLGTRELKGIDQAVRVFDVSWRA